MYQFYLTATAKKQFLALQPTYLKLFIKNIENIQQQNFHGGTRLKKLRSNLDLWETRIDLSLRMLFSIEGNDIYIRHIAISHDEVIKKLKNPLTNLQPQVKLASMLTPIEEDTIEVEAIEQRLYEVNEYVLKQLYEAGDLENVDLKLRLFPEQEKLLLEPLPLFINGVAGSGKSTIMLYRLLLELKERKRNNLTSRIVYLAENKHLLTLVRNDLYKLYHSFSLQRKDLDSVDFLTIAQFFNISEPYLSENTFRAFYKKYAQGNSFFEPHRSHYYYHFIQQVEMLCFVQQLQPKMAILQLEQYSEHIEALYEAYRQFKKEENIRDLSDFILHRECLSPDIDLLLIDEVQDYNAIYIEYLLAVVRSKNHVVIVGDLDQQITESDFSWNKLKSHLFKKEQQVKVHQFERNFRNSEQITNLLNQLLNIRKQFSKINTSTFVAHKQGERPKFMQQPLTSLVNFNGFVFVVPNSAVEREVIEILGDKGTLVLQPTLIKGLEFPNICLVNFNSANSKSLRNLTNESATFLKEIYVAASRPTNLLYIFEQETSDFWLNHFQQLIDIVSEQGDLMKQHVRDDVWFKNAQELHRLGELGKGLQCLRQIAPDQRTEECWLLYYSILDELENEQENIDFAVYPLAEKAYAQIALAKDPYKDVREKIADYRARKNNKGLNHLFSKLLEEEVTDIEILNDCIQFFKEQNLKVKHLRAMALKSKHFK